MKFITFLIGATLVLSPFLLGSTPQLPSYYIIGIQWPRSVCSVMQKGTMTNKCSGPQGIPGRFCIHGLWAQNMSKTAAGQLQDCNDLDPLYYPNVSVCLQIEKNF